MKKYRQCPRCLAHYEVRYVHKCDPLMEKLLEFNRKKKYGHDTQREGQIGAVDEKSIGEDDRHAHFPDGRVV